MATIPFLINIFCNVWSCNFRVWCYPTTLCPRGYSKNNYLEDAGIKPRPAEWQASVLTIKTWSWPLGLSKSLSWNSGEKKFFCVEIWKRDWLQLLQLHYFQPHTKRMPLSGVFIPRTNLNLRTYQLMQIAFRNYIFRKKWKTSRQFQPSVSSSTFLRRIWVYCPEAILEHFETQKVKLWWGKRSFIIKPFGMEPFTELPIWKGIRSLKSIHSDPKPLKPGIVLTRILIPVIGRIVDKRCSISFTEAGPVVHFSTKLSNRT